ncbi:uncharacterized protein AMSG_09452 [Thecamonas trahens ATCC 50062]|uniref:Uncharacterized protein n=1 Tax=Thecamonas trahens ATCC 50062 TaxID=461836 RepID=A0A0L0DN54_THETB|nr:hypothetical protein AMSG_09452 [Thecamonas trahens ATCC 50062]KNC53739.1 hypothetical protein AMSG_09452 [Thecamonas trahens ATCC 50062]|eukprot:XP_013754302.1 hypothetical protein AMSG_09452 [Thecamonas trahens ATCC 50062]
MSSFSIVSVSLSDDLSTPPESESSLTLLEYPICRKCCISREERVTHKEAIKRQRRIRALRAGQPDPYPPKDGKCACWARRCPAECVVWDCCRPAPATAKPQIRSAAKRKPVHDECSYSPEPLSYSSSSTEWELFHDLRKAGGKSTARTYKSSRSRP